MITIDDCLFCKIARGVIPVELLHDDGDLVAFADIAPKAPMHLLIVPVEHIPSVADIDSRHDALVGRAMRLGGELARARGYKESGYRIVANSGPHGGQSVQHLHIHVLAGRQMQWPPG